MGFENSSYRVNSFTARVVGICALQLQFLSGKSSILEKLSRLLIDYRVLERINIGLLK